MAKLPTLLGLPADQLKRLKGLERSARAAAKAKKLPVETISIQALWILQRGTCGCPGRCGPLNPDAKPGDDGFIVLGSKHIRRFKGWHTSDNVCLQRSECRQRHVRPEKRSGEITTRSRTPKRAPTREICTCKPSKT